LRQAQKIPVESRVESYRIVDVTFCQDSRYPTFMLANINPRFDIEYNLKRLEEITEAAHRNDADILVLPELVISGYLWGAGHNKDVHDQLKASLNHQPEVKATLDRINESLTRSGAGLKMVFFGNSRYDPNRDRLHDTAFIMAPGLDYNTVFYDKIFLTPLEKLYFHRGTDQRLLLDTAWGKFGVVICYDMCFVELGKRYAFEDEADVIISLSAWRAEARREYPMLGIKIDDYYRYIWNLMHSAMAAHNQVWSIGANYCGVFDKSSGRYCGQSSIWSPSGIPLAKASGDEEELLIIRNVDIRGHMRHQAIEHFNYSLDFNEVYREIKETPPRHINLNEG
jgi:predicted amidohydrolase